MNFKGWVKFLFRPYRCAYCGKRIKDDVAGLLSDPDPNAFHDRCLMKSIELNLWDVTYDDEGVPCSVFKEESK
jgi:hypothetical protein